MTENEQESDDLLPGQIPIKPARARIQELRPWEAEAEAMEPPKTWTVEWVAHRLVEAFEILDRLPVITRPQAFCTAWPEHGYDAGDRMQQLLNGTAAEEFSRTPKGATFDEIARMEQAIAWPMRYLQDDVLAGKTVLMWAARSARGFNARLLPERLGASRRSCWRARQRGLESIVAALIKARVPVT